MKFSAVLTGVMVWVAITVSTAVAHTSAVPTQCLNASKIICVSKTDRKVRLFENGKVVLAMDARFGDARGSAFRTAEGSFTILRKEAMSWSQPFKVWMPYAMYFHGGQAIHYSYSFASEGYNGASHGCVNIRNMAKLKVLFDRIQVGTPVYIYRS